MKNPINWMKQNWLGHRLLPPCGIEEIQKIFGTFEYRESSTKSGWIEIDTEWTKHNIKFCELPHGFTIQCHRLLIPIIQRIFSDVDEAGLFDQIEMLWCYAPRHKNHNINSSLSTHAWGIALDINPDRNRPNTPNAQFTREHPIIRIFKAHGFEWGGDWKNFKDPMHLQYCTGY